MKSIYYKVAICILKILVGIQEKWQAYKTWRLCMFVNQQILADCNYDYNVLVALTNKTNK